MTADYRNAYLIEWRQGLWSQIRQKEDAIWRFVTFYSAAIVLAVGLIQSASSELQDASAPIGASTSILILLLVSFYGLAIVLDANFWLRRNLIFVSNIDREMLDTDDIGTLLPRAYVEPKSLRYKGSYEMHTHLLASIILLGLGTFGLFSVSRSPLTDIELAVASSVVVAFSVGLWSVMSVDRARAQEYAWVLENAPGRGPRALPLPTNVQVALHGWSAPLGPWHWGLAFWGLGIFSFVGYLNGLVPLLETRAAAGDAALLAFLVGASGLIISVHFTKRFVPGYETTTQTVDPKEIPSLHETSFLLSSWKVASFVMHMAIILTVLPWGIALIRLTGKLVL